MSKPQIKEHWYFARILPPSHTYEVCELIIRTVEDDYFVGVDKRDKHAYLLSYSDVGKRVFKDRGECLDLVLQQEATDKEVEQ